MRHIIGSTLSFFLTFYAAPLFAQYTGYWNEAISGGKKFPCQLAEDAETLKSTLREAGWPAHKGFPSIDWKNDCAVVISPEVYYKDGQLSLYGLAWEGDAFYLKYGWEPTASENVGTSSASFGSVGDGTPGVIVVSFKHYMHGSNKFVCSNLGFDP